jgi:hypothetical protein
LTIFDHKLPVGDVDIIEDLLLFGESKNKINLIKRPSIIAINGLYF